MEETATVTAALPAIMTSKDVAAVLGVHVKTIRNWAADGKFPGVFRTSPGMKGRWKFPRTAVEAFLSRQAKDQAKLGHTRVYSECA